MGLIAAEFERSGVPTVAIQLLKSLAITIRPPRSLCVPFSFGYPLGKAGDPDQQKDVLSSALQLLELRDEAPPLIVEYHERDRGPSGRLPQGGGVGNNRT